MKFLERVAKRFGFVRAGAQGPARPTLRSFSAATTSRLTSDWLSPGTSADAELRGAVATLRDKCREGERNDDYLKRYLKLCERNVVGAKGIGLQVKALIEAGNRNAGTLDKDANSAIEGAWSYWGTRENCCVTRQLSWRGVCRLVLRSVKRDGGALVRFITGYDNDFGFALQLFEIDQLDLEYNAILPNGGQVRMGVEFDSWRAPVAYHLLTVHPGDNGLVPRTGRRRQRVPVSEMLHVFLPERIDQTIGAPEPSSTLTRLKMLSGYEEAELVAAREAACKGYGIKKATPENFSGDVDTQGRSLQDIEPGMGLELNPGEEYFGIDPQHPMDAFPSFVKSQLRGAAAGLGVSYNSLANDLESVNYSSLRVGSIDEREGWMDDQESILIEPLCWPVYKAWLSHSLAFGKILLPSGSALPASKYQKFATAAEWKPRRWAWVDPEKEIRAMVLQIEKGLNSRRRIIAEQGGDIEDLFLEQKEDNDLAASYGLEFPTDVQSPESKVQSLKSDG